MKMNNIYKPVVAAVLFVMFLMPGAAYAKHNKKMTINYDDLWSGSIRYLRIEKNFEIKDKDKEAGYIIFIYKYPNDKKKTSRATMEFIVKGKTADGKSKVNIQVNIETAPEFLEIHLVTGLVEKLKKEYDTD